MIRVKICGLTSANDARAAALAGADAIGINFVGGPRKVEPRRAAGILDAIPPFCTPVALVELAGGAIPPELAALFARYRLNHLQLYGDASPDALARLAADGFRLILVEHATADDYVARISDRLGGIAPTQPSALLVDAHMAGMKGGTGKAFDWDRLASAQAAGSTAAWPPLILAGGLNPDNVAEAVRKVRPWAVDVSSGVEVEPGCKDEQRMRRFVAEARAAAN